MLRSFVAVIVGFFTIVLLSLATDSLFRAVIPGAFSDTGRTESAPLLLFILFYVFAICVFGCWLAARIARRKPMKQALILGVVVFFFGLLAAITLWETAPAWYHIASILLVIPAAWLGGTIGQRQILRGAPPIP